MALPRAFALRLAACTTLLVCAPGWVWAQAASAPESASPRALSTADVALLAAACANCHGPDGRSTGGIPSLRDQDPAHLLARMEALRSARPAVDATVMPRLLKGYDSAELQALARWFGRKESR